MSRLLPAAMLMLTITGCVVPAPPIAEVRSGHKYAGAEVAFLNEPNITRAEVIATLGPATHESRDGRVHAYVWTTATPRGVWMLGMPGPIGLVGESGVWESTSRWALLIAFNGEDCVARKEVRRIAIETTLEEECVKWSRDATQ
jgi:hypothetical protein